MRLSFAIVDFQVKKMFADFLPTVQLKSEIEIEEKLETIREFIIICGWTIDDFVSLTLNNSSHLN